MDSPETTETKGQEELLRQEMRQDAERKTQRITQRAERDAAKMLDGVRDEMDTVKSERLTAAKHTAEERVLAILAGIDHERRRQLLLDREIVIQRVLEEAMKRIDSSDETQRGVALERLLKEAVGDLGCDDAEIHCASRDIAQVEKIAKSAKVAAKVVADPAISGGLLVECDGGRRAFDNTYKGRLGRKISEVRAIACAGISGDPREYKADDQRNSK